MSKTLFVKGSFVDFEGKERKFVIAGVVEKVEGSAFVYHKNGDYTEIVPIEKHLSVGISICHSLDTYNDEIGMRQAEGRALKGRSDVPRDMFSSVPGMLNDKTVMEQLKNTAECLAAKPECFSKGYRAAKIKWEAKQKK